MPNNPTIFTLDYTGLASSNRISGEIVTLGTSQSLRSITPQHSPFFGDNVVVTDDTRGIILQKGVDYKCLDMVSLATAQSGKDIYSTLLILNSGAGPRFKIDYNTIGGRYIQDYTSLQVMVDNLSNDNRPVAWPNISNRPVVFDPTMHLHSASDLIGFEFVVTALETLKNAIMMGDQKQSDAILGYIDDQVSTLLRLIGSTTDGLQSQGLVLAQAASTRATQALTLVQGSQATAQSLSDALTALQSSLIAIQQAAAFADSEAVVLASQYPAAFSAFSASALIKQPSSLLEAPITYEATSDNVIVDTDWYAIDSTGKGLTNQGGTLLSSVTNSMMSLMLSTNHDAVTGLARLDITIKTHDRRLSNLTGVYPSSCSLILLPIRFEDGVEDPTPIVPYNNRYTLSLVPVGGTITDATYQVTDIDPDPVEMSQNNQQAHVDKIASYLLDSKSEYNVANYGSVPNRRSVKFTLPPGTELNFSFHLSALHAADIEKTISLRFYSRCTISTATKVNNVLTSSITASALEANRVRCISVRF